uniref:Uncharacterized protein n=1 Tax=Percolomonas cosmopolitus TaxID=63605 RepID=A0A7S1KQN6_9EUKA|mmetsp:Transcript_4376/g.16493  ORF Transcript_4376/g.16493 Transcript_4376/m.16493 type:complete len:804 (+) Transcript_4376:293-2704(+)|eukprot:CAMPEP_0117438520 /NCGR_PEP_ID=MMETSP0759-20121206/2095_1 /TAXON_ID=63605 /ORGANISM="Percolomonas cosmopolitus, Strain WS" /LENGTH=803 /DNA_ID=CAMNT_0005230213 /DNA_START=282 /DNA_END=2693 /DNA_ORIENTATION=+
MFPNRYPFQDTGDTFSLFDVECDSIPQQQNEQRDVLRNANSHLPFATSNGAHHIRAHPEMGLNDFGASVAQSQRQQQMAPLPQHPRTEIDLTQASQESTEVEETPTASNTNTTSGLPSTEDNNSPLNLAVLSDDDDKEGRLRHQTISDKVAAATPTSANKQQSFASSKKEVISIPDSQEFDDECSILYSSTQAEFSNLEEEQESHTNEQKREHAEELSHSAQSLKVGPLSLEMEEPLGTPFSLPIELNGDDDDMMDEFRQFHSTVFNNRKRKRSQSDIEPQALFSSPTTHLQSSPISGTGPGGELQNESVLSSTRSPSVSSHITTTPSIAKSPEMITPQSSSMRSTSPESSSAFTHLSIPQRKRLRIEPTQHAFSILPSFYSPPALPQISSSCAPAVQDNIDGLPAQHSQHTMRTTPPSSASATTGSGSRRFRIYSRTGFKNKRVYTLSADLLALLEKEFEKMDEAAVIKCQERNALDRNILLRQKDVIKKCRHIHSPPLPVLVYQYHHLQWISGEGGCRPFNTAIEVEAKRTALVIEKFWEFLETELGRLGKTYFDLFQEYDPREVLDKKGLYMLLTSNPTDTWIYVGKTMRSIRERLLGNKMHCDHLSTLLDPFLFGGPPLIHMTTLLNRLRMYGWFIGEPKNEYAMDVLENLVIVFAHRFANCSASWEAEALGVSNVHCTNIDIKSPDNFREAFQIEKHEHTIPMRVPEEVQKLIVERSDCWAKKNSHPNSLCIHRNRGKKVEMKIPSKVFVALMKGRKYYVGDLGFKKDYNQPSTYPHVIQIEEVKNCELHKDWYYLRK